MTTEGKHSKWCAAAYIGLFEWGVHHRVTRPQVESKKHCNCKSLHHKSAPKRTSNFISRNMKRAVVSQNIKGDESNVVSLSVTGCVLLFAPRFSCCRTSSRPRAPPCGISCRSCTRSWTTKWRARSDHWPTWSTARAAETSRCLTTSSTWGRRRRVTRCQCRSRRPGGSRRRRYELRRCPYKV